MADLIALDFTKKRSRDTMGVMLAAADGGEQLEIHILTPTKRGFDILSKVAEILESLSDGDISEDTLDMDAMFSEVADVMSHNTDGIKVTPEYLETIGFDIEDVGLFVAGMIEFVNKLVESKNSLFRGTQASTENHG